MNLLTAELIKDLLPEGIDPSRKKVIGMFGGGFKPPTIGHLEVVKRALQENPEMDALIILVGSGTRNSISQDESLAIWNIYKKYLPNKVRVMASPEGKAPIAAIYSYAKKNPDKEVYWFLGAREGNEEDFQDIMKRTQSLRKGDYSNLKVKEVVTTGAVSGTKARQALLNQDKDTFIQFLPDIPEVDEIWDLLADIVTERINFTPDFITKGDVEFVDDMADRKLAPIEIDLSGNHFFDRLNDPRNYPDISVEELEDFFDKLSDEKEEFIEFLQQYKDVVVKDTETNINIPFMKMANKAIAKTVMRKKNFQTPDKILPLQEIATGSYDGETTIQSRYIINQLKDNLGVYYEEELKRKLKDKKYTLEFKLNPVEPKGLDYAPYLIDAAGGKDGIELIINYEPSSYPQFLNDLIAELKDTLRHELEHVGQENFEKGIRIGNVKNDANLSLPEYLTLDYEIPAFIRGLNKKAKTKNITLGKAIDEFFLERADEISYEEEAYVKRKWVEWIKNNLPDTPLNESILNENLEGDLESYTTSLSDYMSNQDLNIQPYPSLEFIDSDEENAGNIFGKTAYYMPSDKKIVLYTLGRHPKDILRSFAHEMIHHHQNLNGTLGNIQTTNTNEDDELDIIEREAYEQGNIMFRNWTDSLTDSLNESFYLDIPKFNQPKTIQQYLIESINEINLSKENAADINGDLTGGTFAVDDITYEYSIKNIPNPYKDLGLFYNIQFTPRGEVTSIPKGGKENYIKILSTMRKIIVDFMEQKNPDYVGISSLDNSGSKNYHTVYNRLTSNPANLLPGYFRKDSNLEFDSPQGKGRFIVLKSKQKIKNEN
jgi:cytidyltransferase-like protein